MTAIDLLTSDRVREQLGSGAGCVLRAVPRSRDGGHVFGVLPVVDVLLGEVQPDGKEALGTLRGGVGVAVAGARGHVGPSQVRERARALRREGDVDRPLGSVLVEARIGALDVVAGETDERRFVARFRPVRDLGVSYPFGIDELGDAPDRLLRLVRRDPGQIDGDAVVVRAGATDLGLTDPQRVDAFVDHVDRALLDGGARLAGREAGELVIDVSSTRKVEAFVDVELPAEVVRRKAGDPTCHRVVIHGSVDVAGSVDGDRSRKKQDDEQPNGPAQDQLQHGL